MNPDFRSFCLSHGVVAPEVILPEKWMRVKTQDHQRKRNGSVKMFADGRVGLVMNWATMSSPAVWKEGGERETKLPDFREINSRRLERARITEKAKASALAYWNRCTPLRGPHPYLAGKDLGVEGCAGLRLGPQGELVVPMMIAGKLSSVQRIWEDGSKKFWPDAPTKGATFTLWRKDSTVTILCEGLATGLTLYSAVTQASVVIAFSAHNMVTVAGWMKPTGMVVIASDNDVDTQLKTGSNPGLEAAQKAAKLWGCGIAIPDCRGSDFQDQMHERIMAKMDDRMLSSFKKRPDLIRREVLAEIRMAVLRAATFIPPLAS